MNDMKFKFDYLNNRFWKVGEEYNYEVLEENQFTTPYGGQGFILDSNQPNHWINFTVYDRIIRVFYKQVSKVNGDEIITYYQKDIPKEIIIEFGLTEKDIVAKRDDKWVKKNS